MCVLLLLNVSTKCIFEMYLLNESFQPEYVYRLLLRSVLRPLGASDSRPGLRPTDLSTHIQEVRHPAFKYRVEVLGRAVVIYI